MLLQVPNSNSIVVNRSPLLRSVQPQPTRRLFIFVYRLSACRQSFLTARHAARVPRLPSSFPYPLRAPVNAPCVDAQEPIRRSAFQDRAARRNDLQAHGAGPWWLPPL